MRSTLRTVYFGLLALCGLTAMAQSSVTIMGGISPCTGTSYPVRILTYPGTVPMVDTVINTDADCTYSYTFHPTTGPGGITVMTSCDGGLTWGVSDSTGYSTPLDTVGIYLTCSGGPCIAPTITPTPETLTTCSTDTFNLAVSATGTAPFSYNWSGPGMFYPDSTSASVFIYSNIGAYYHVTVSNACGTAEADVPVTLTPAPDAGISVDTSLCGATGPVSLLSLLGGTPDVGGVWSVNGAPHSFLYDPILDSPGVYLYMVSGTAPCPNAMATVTITGLITWYGDADGDGLGDPNITVQSCSQPAGYVSNAYDECPSVLGTVGSVCDDGDPLTSNDHLNLNCECVGTDSASVDCLGIPGGPNVVGSLCTDSIGGLMYMGNWDANCICVPGTFFDCLSIPGGSDLPGTACTDTSGAAGTWDASCYCVPDPSTTTCNADFWVIQAYDSTETGVEPIPNEVWVLNLSSGGNGNYQFLWNFGDGTTSTEAYPTHEYDGPGPWQLCLSMASDSCFDDHCDSVSVDANGILNQLVIGGGNGNVAHEATTGERSGGFTLNVIQHIPTGISENPAFAELKAWPNPVLNELNLSFNTSVSGMVPVTVIDPSGRSVIAGSQQLTTGSNTFRISTSTLAPGLYMVRIGNDARSITQRFMKVQ